MADPAAQEAAMKERVIKHMNKDHADSLALYLQHYLNVSPWGCRGVAMTNIKLSSMTFRTKNGKIHQIPLEPPMKSWSEVRTRTVDMDRECRTALGISPIKITKYEPPRSPFHIFVFGIVLFTYALFNFRTKIVPGTWVYDTALPWFPGGPEWFLWLVKTIAWPTYAIHITEAYLLDKTKLRKHGVQRGTKVWMMWMISCFIEGYGCFDRINKTVEKKKLEADKEH